MNQVKFWLYSNEFSVENIFVVLACDENDIKVQLHCSLASAFYKVLTNVKLFSFSTVKIFRENFGIVDICREDVR